MASDELSAIDYIYVGEYVLHGNSRKAFAAARPDYTGHYATELAWRMYKNPLIKAEIDRCRAAARDKAQLTADDVMRDIKNVLAADARELTEFLKGACRYCHGRDFKYQRTPQEERNAVALYLESDAIRRGIEFDPLGGVGYSPNKEPHADCPECHGKGVRSVVACDTRELSEAGAALYAGTKPTAHGVEILTRSKDQARKDAAAILGLNKATLDVSHTFKAKDLDDDELAAIAKGANIGAQPT